MGFKVELADNYDLEVDMTEVYFVSRKTGKKFEMNRDQFKCMTCNEDEISHVMLKLGPGPCPFGDDWPTQFYRDMGDGMHMIIENEPLLVIANEWGEMVKLTLHDYSCITHFTYLMASYSVTLID